MYRTGRDLFPVLAEIIKNAKDEVLLSSYALADDGVGRSIIDALKKAAYRGVKIRVLLDAFGTRDHVYDIERELSREGIESRIFRPIRKWIVTHPLLLLCRNHTRIILIDRTLFGLGGMGLRNTDLDRQDLFILQRTRFPDAVAAYFERLWFLASKVHLDETLSDQKSQENKIDFGLLTSGPNKKDQQIYHWILEKIIKARNRITIVSPFFFPDHKLQHVLLGAIERGVHVQLITPQRTDKPRYDRFIAMPAPQLLKYGAQWLRTCIYFHAKFVIIDGSWTFGSANFDIISTKRNYDLNITGEDGKILKKLEQEAEHLAKNSEKADKFSVHWLLRWTYALSYHVIEFFLKLT